jgi:hypothetical protein
VVDEPSSEQALSLQGSGEEVPTLQRAVPSEALKVTQVDELPRKVEQPTLFKTQPAPLVLHPERKVLHSSFVVAVVLSVHSLTLQATGDEVEAPETDQHF